MRTLRIFHDPDATEKKPSTLEGVDCENRRQGRIYNRENLNERQKEMGKRFPQDPEGMRNDFLGFIRKSKETERAIEEWRHSSGTKKTQFPPMDLAPKFSAW